MLPVLGHVANGHTRHVERDAGARRDGVAPLGEELDEGSTDVSAAEKPDVHRANRTGAGHVSSLNRSS